MNFFVRPIHIWWKKVVLSEEHTLTNATIVSKHILLGERLRFKGGNLDKITQLENSRTATLYV